MYRCTRKKGTIHVHVLVVHVHEECSVRLPIGIEILRCVILGRLLVITKGDRNHSQLSPTFVLCDNLGAVHTSANPVSSKRSKHVDIRYLKIREYQNSNV